MASAAVSKNSPSENIRKKYIPKGLLKQLKNIVRKECKKWKALNTFSVTMATP